MANLPKAIKDKNSGPIHLINTAVKMDLPEAGLDERHTGSCAFGPYGCGYSVPFHAKSENYEPGVSVDLADCVSCS